MLDIDGNPIDPSKEYRFVPGETIYLPKKERWLMNPLPGFTETKDIGVRVYPESSLDYGEFMRTTTSQERVAAIAEFMLQKLWYEESLSPDSLKGVFQWMIEAAGPQGYEVVPLDWIRKLRQAKAGAK